MFVLSYFTFYTTVLAEYTKSVSVEDCGAKSRNKPLKIKDVKISLQLKIHGVNRIIGYSLVSVDNRTRAKVECIFVFHA